LIVADEIVVVQGLLKQYKSVTALDGLSLVVRRGEIYGLLGPNGAGKTTAIQILMGVLTPSGGDVGVFGLSPFKDRHRLAGRVNFSSAYVQLPFNLSVGQNLDIFARLYGVPDRAAKIASLLESFRLADKAKARTGSLSSGEQTRLNLCKALLNDPELLFLDEPTASLDPDIADLVRTALQGFQRQSGLTIVYTSHNMAEVEALCDRVLFLHRGKAITEGTPKEVANRFEKDNLEKVFIHLARTGDVMDAQTVP
jgi:ABC-2 type transport system ATP-binding protein